jgi:hypothetical protein
MNKKKALDYLQTSAPIAVSSSSQELSSDDKGTENSGLSKYNLDEWVNRCIIPILLLVISRRADMGFLFDSPIGIPAHCYLF